jgi:uncharacterized protein YbaR (Trm112 family)
MTRLEILGLRQRLAKGAECGATTETPSGGKSMAISPDLLEILVCPESKAPLVLDGETLVSTDAKTRRRYKIKDDIPVMLIDESEVLAEADWKAILEKHGVKPFESK